MGILEKLVVILALGTVKTSWRKWCALLEKRRAKYRRPCVDPGSCVISKRLTLLQREVLKSVDGEIDPFRRLAWTLTWNSEANVLCLVVFQRTLGDLKDLGKRTAGTSRGCRRDPASWD